MAPPAAAQTGYPPGLCTILSGSQFAGNVTVGQTFTVRVSPACLFTPGALATVVVNGSTPFTKTVNADGTVTLTISILSQTEASVNPIVPIGCGINTITVTAPSAVAGNRLVTQTVTFNLVCPGITVEINICNAGDGGNGGSGLGLGGTAGSTGSGTSTGGAGTGSGGNAGDGGDACNVTLVSGPATGPGGPGGPSGPSGPGGAGGAGGGGGAGGAGGGGGAGGAGGGGGAGGAGGVVSLLARTGADFGLYAAAALALVLVGTGLTVAARRRRAAH